ncbi:protein YhfH [Cytobacillus sp. FJAT-53684]|uniref:Protein YhfH n=1 Tax=Cytobacillus mangrovibacter TaxID=3299024 RepID=A0ABW6JTL2_9BACI
MLNNSVESYKAMQGKVCPECGKKVHEQTESYLMECDRCLSKRAE